MFKQFFKLPIWNLEVSVSFAVLNSCLIFQASLSRQRSFNDFDTFVSENL